MDAFQEFVPEAVPAPLVAAFDHFTLLTPTLSVAVPPTANGDAVAVQVGAVVGAVMVTAGGVVSLAADTARLVAPSTSATLSVRPAALRMLSPFPVGACEELTRDTLVLCTLCPNHGTSRGKLRPDCKEPCREQPGHA